MKAGNSSLGVDAEIAEFSAEFECILVVCTDGCGGVVHQRAVSFVHHVATQAGVNCGTSGMRILIAIVAAVILSVALPSEWDALAVVTLVLLLGARAVGFVALVHAVVVTVTNPASVDTLLTVGTAELVTVARAHTVGLVPVVLAVVVSVTQPGVLDTQVVVTLGLSRAARVLVAVEFISKVVTVVVAVTPEL